MATSIPTHDEMFKELPLSKMKQIVKHFASSTEQTENAISMNAELHRKLDPTSKRKLEESVQKLYKRTMYEKAAKDPPIRTSMVTPPSLLTRVSNSVLSSIKKALYRTEEAIDEPPPIADMVQGKTTTRNDATVETTTRTEARVRTTGLKTTITAVSGLISMTYEETKLHLLEKRSAYGVYHNVRWTDYSAMNSNASFLLNTILKNHDKKRSLDTISSIKDFDDREKIQTSNVIAFLNDHGIITTELTSSYEDILTTMQDDDDPVLIAYQVSRHKKEDTGTALAWTQLALLYSNDEVLLPFNHTGSNILLGSQIHSQDFRYGFDTYCKTNLNYRIAPVDRVDGKGRDSLTRTLQFQGAWKITS